MIPKSYAAAVIVILAVIAAGLTVKSGPVGRIKGTIVDSETGDPVVGASVTVVGTTRLATTDAEGNFLITRLVPGTYTVRISHVNYETIKITDVAVDADLTTEISRSMVQKSRDRDNNAVEEPESGVADVPKIVPRRKSAMKEELATTVILRGADKSRQMGYAGQPSADATAYYPPAHGGTAIVNGEAFDAMFFKNYGVNPFVDTEDDHFSTFAIDVDDASYIMTRSYIERGSLPPDEAVRVEEFVNHFSYNYNPPRNDRFDIFFEGAPSKFGQNCQLLKIGIKGMKVDPEDRKPANLVFVIDVSGSMGREDRLGLVKKALRLLVDELDENDRVGIVVYGSRGRVVLKPTSIARKNEILSAIEFLAPEGATNAEEGLRLGYEMADRIHEEGKINRIILCSDGVANVGRTGPDDILKQIKKYAEKGITLTAVGFGMGNYNDILMEKLGNKGNGHYAYVDDLAEARRIFVENLTGTLQVIARDVKIQVDFDTSAVRSYRLLGYENRDVADSLFRVDTVDGGEIGAGHEVTALYEIKLHQQAPKGDLGRVYVRFKDPDYPEDVTEVSRRISQSLFRRSFESTSPEFKLAAAAAEFAEILRKSYWARGSRLEDVLDLTKEVNLETDSDAVIELMALVSKAQQYEQQLAER